MAFKTNPLAQQLNERLEKAAPSVLAMLSPLGRRLYFPKGILSQSAEAKQKAKRFNATIGIATEKGGPMYLPSMQRHLVEISPNDAYNYAPPAGRQTLRERWREKIVAENPSLHGKSFGMPITTSAPLPSTLPSTVTAAEGCVESAGLSATSAVSPARPSPSTPRSSRSWTD